MAGMKNKKKYIKLLESQQADLRRIILENDAEQIEVELVITQISQFIELVTNPLTFEQKQKVIEGLK